MSCFSENPTIFNTTFHYYNRSSYKASEGDDVYSEPDHPTVLPSKPKILPSTNADIYSEIADTPGPQGFFNPMYTSQTDLQDDTQQPASSFYDKLDQPIKNKKVPSANELYSTVEDTASSLCNTSSAADDYEDMSVPVDIEQ